MDDLAAITEACAARNARAADLHAATIAVYDAIRDAAGALGDQYGAQQRLVEASGYKREHVRRIVNSPRGTVPPRPARPTRKDDG